jgi:hypothetical protein
LLIKFRIGYQQKGWTDGEIGAAWMKIFEEVTRGKAKGEHRLLLVDGHNSHYTVAFLLLARLSMIIVLCYPAHGTHIYQGLDVVIFAILKLLLGQERDKLLRDTGKAINKSNFLSVISNAYTRALTPGNIRTAFRKTGIYPFNPNVITPDMLAPSKETSLESHLPVETSEGTKIFADMLRKLRSAEEVESDSSDSNESLDPSDSKTPDPTDSETSEKETTEASTSTPTSTTRRTCSTNLKHINILEETVAALKKTNLAYLATHTPTTSSDTMPKTATRTGAQVAGPVNTTAAALTIEPSTSNELLLLAALRESESRNVRTEIHAFELQASNILNEAYVERLRKALETKEEKKNKKRKVTKLVGDGLPRLLTGDKFYELAKEKEREVREIEKQKEARKGGKVAYRMAIEEWDEAEQARKDETTTIKANWEKSVAAWTRKKAAAAKKGNKFTEKKPKRDALPRKTPKPKLKDFVGGGNQVESGDEAADEAADETGDDADQDRSDSSASDNENDENTS